MNQSDNPLLVGKETLHHLAVHLLQAVGVSAEDSEIVTEHLVTSSLMGIDSHGIMRLPQYLDLMEKGEINPRAHITPLKKHHAISAFEGSYCLGPVAGVFAARQTIDMARTFGISITLMRHIGHTGRIGAYTELMAESNVAGIAFCNSPIHGHFVAPPHAREGRLATNPIAYAFPGAAIPVRADFATSAITEGGLRLLHKRRLDAPSDVLLNKHGLPTQHTDDFYHGRGSILPLGGLANGHKGFALGLLVEILAGTCAGDSVLDPTVKGNNLTLIGIDVEQLPAGTEFPTLLQTAVEYIHSARAIHESVNVMVPGEREMNVYSVRTEQGIPLDHFVWADLLERATRIGYNVV